MSISCVITLINYDIINHRRTEIDTKKGILNPLAEGSNPSWPTNDFGELRRGRVEPENVGQAIGKQRRRSRWYVSHLFHNPPVPTAVGAFFVVEGSATPCPLFSESPSPFPNLSLPVSRGNPAANNKTRALMQAWSDYLVPGSEYVSN